MMSPQRFVVKAAPVQSPPRPAAAPVAPASRKEETKPAVDDDIEQRFEQALQRTKKIVDGFPGKPQEQPQLQESIYAMLMSSAQNIQTQKSEDDQEPEDLALQYEDGFIYRGQGFQPQTRSGFGILTDQQDNEVYAGFWKENYYHGQGKLNNIDQEARDTPIDWEDMTSIGNCWSSYDGT